MIDKSGNITFKTIQTKVVRAPEVQTPNQAPVVLAKSITSLHIFSGEGIHLEDDGSYDPDGKIVSYEWRDMEGILLSDTKALHRGLHYYPQYDKNGDGTIRYTKTLRVTDDKGKTASKSFEIIVHKLPNRAPIATSQNITVIEDSTNNTIRLRGSDIDGDTLAYRILTNPTNGTLSVS